MSWPRAQNHHPLQCGFGVLLKTGKNTSLGSNARFRLWSGGSGAGSPILAGRTFWIQGTFKSDVWSAHMYQRKFSENSEKIFFPRKNFRPKNFFQKKKVEKNVLSLRSLANFLNRLKDTGTGTVLEVLFLSRKSQKRWFLKVLCSSKNRCLSNFCVLFFCRQNVLQKSREDKPPSCFAKMWMNTKQSLEVLCPVRCVVACALRSALLLST